MLPILLKHGPNKANLQRALYLLGDGCLRGETIYCLRVSPPSPRRATQAKEFAGERARVPGDGRPGRSPGPDATRGGHVVAAAMRGARSRGPGARRAPAGRQLCALRMAKRRKWCPPRAEHELPRPPALLESSPCRSARPSGREEGKERRGRGEGSGVHAPGTGGATRKARSRRRSSHRPASEGHPCGSRRLRVRPGQAPSPRPASPRPALSPRQARAPHLSVLLPQTRR